jgi:RNA polymerase-binding transcription factor DksA
MQAHTGDFQAVRTVLLDRREELRRRLTEVRADIQRHAEPLSPDFAEQANERENDEVLEALQRTTESELAEVDSALGRLRAGTYGECRACGYPIEPRRLEAVPCTDRCSLCATQRT